MRKALMSIIALAFAGLLFSASISIFQTALHNLEEPNETPVQVVGYDLYE